MSLGQNTPPPPTHAYTRRQRNTGHSPKPGDVERGSHYLHAGRYFASTEATSVTTILGSCVAVCLCEPRLKIGGINHFMMPDWVGEGRMSPRFGNVAIASLVDNLVALGCRAENLEAKLFGGASVMGSPGPHQGLLGTRNVRLAQALLDEEGIPIVGGDIGGQRGRKLIFQTDDGASWVKRL